MLPSALNLCTLLLGEATSAKVVQTAKSKTLQHREGVIGSQLENTIKMLLCSVLLSTETSDVMRLDCILMRAPLYFGNHPKGRSFFWNPEVLKSRGKEREEKKKKQTKPSQICECGPSYTRLPTRHSKCMQSYSCAAASLIRTLAQAFTDASVWKYHINLLT